MVSAPPCHGGGRGFKSRRGRSGRVISDERSSKDAVIAYLKVNTQGSVAQLVERTTENREVSGSIPLGATAHERALAYAGPFHFCFISSWYILRQLLTQKSYINTAAGAGTDLGTRLTATSWW